VATQPNLCNGLLVPPGFDPLPDLGPPLDPQQFDLNDPNPGFGDLAQEFVGPIGGPRDDFDVLVIDGLQLLDALDQALNSLGTDLLEVFTAFFGSDWTPETFGQAFDAYLALQPAGDALVVQLGDLVARQAVPLECSVSLTYTGSSSGIYPDTFRLQLTNNSGAALEISSTALDQQAGEPWSYSTDLVGTWPAGATRTITFNVAAAPRPGTQARVVVYTGAHQPVAVVCVDVLSPPAGGPGGAGIGGGGGTTGGCSPPRGGVDLGFCLS